jgi:uncharacterized membrane protein
LALVSIVPAERTENLVYLLLPTAIALTIAYHLTRSVQGEEIIINVELWPVIIGIIAPVLAILLYEFSVDECILKGFYRLRLNNSSDELRNRLAIAHLVLETWENEMQEPPSVSPELKDYLGKLTKAEIEETVSSYYIHRQFWRMRATIYLTFSIPLFIYTLGNYSIDMEFVSYPLLVPISVVFYLLPISFIFIDLIPHRNIVTKWYYLMGLVVLVFSSPILAEVIGIASRNVLVVISLSLVSGILYSHLRRSRRFFRSSRLFSRISLLARISS